MRGSVEDPNPSGLGTADLWGAQNTPDPRGTPHLHNGSHPPSLGSAGAPPPTQTHLLLGADTNALRCSKPPRNKFHPFLFYFRRKRRRSGSHSFRCGVLSSARGLAAPPPRGRATKLLLRGQSGRGAASLVSKASFSHVRALSDGFPSVLFRFYQRLNHHCLEESDGGWRRTCSASPISQSSKQEGSEAELLPSSAGTQ